jgi:hypothetical protein
MYRAAGPTLIQEKKWAFARVLKPVRGPAARPSDRLLRKSVSYQKVSISPRNWLQTYFVKALTPLLSLPFRAYSAHPESRALRQVPFYETGASC